MDIFAHGLWTAAAAKAINNKLRAKREAHKEGLPDGELRVGPVHKPLNVWQATFWGMFPDLFAFTIPFFVLTLGIFSGTLNFSQIPRPHSVPTTTLESEFPVFRLAYDLYDVSHSLIVFAVIFLLVWLIFKGPVWEMGGWLLHVLIDIPTHSAQFFPTPLFWPISRWRFLYGFSWGEGWFMILNYSALVIVYFLLWRRKKKAVQK